MDDTSNISTPAAVGRAFYLASSWTWCIGMFLPLVLLRDFGPWAWVVFATPNVLGAGAMGWILSRPGASEALVKAHRPAMRLFSLVTVAFHAAFFVFVLTPMLRFTGVQTWMIWLPVAALVLSRGLLGVLGSIFAYAVSVVAMFVLVDHQAITLAQAELPHPLLDSSQLLFMLPVCTFGFLFCPYLDLTFHRARRETTSSGARLAFSLGFGVLFLIMIACTPLYGPLFWTDATRKAAIAAGMAIPVWLHISTQLMYTCGIHSAESGEERDGKMVANVWSRVCLVVLVAAIAIAWLAMRHIPDAPLLAAESNTPLIWYRLFMSAYGLLFPAYVWICMIPRRGERSLPPTLRHILIWLVSCLAAAPFYWIGFMNRQTIWLVPGLAVVLACRALIPHRVMPLPPPPSGV